MDETTLTVTDAQSIGEGDKITMYVDDRRRYMRLWRFITFRSPPMKEEAFYVTSVDSGTTLTISPEAMAQM